MSIGGWRAILVLPAILMSAAFASPPQSMEAPQCSIPQNPDLTFKSLTQDEKFLRPPLVVNRLILTGIYQAFERELAPLASAFFPTLKFDEHRNYVRITRVANTKTGKPPQKALVMGQERDLHVSRAAPISMRIGKCDGRISELFLDIDKLN